VSVLEAALLVVDDNEDNRYTLTRRLQREGYTNLATAVDGRQALKILHSQRFDLVLLDVMMPEMNGYQVLEHLKADPNLRDVPVIMISALDQMDSIVRCIELGAEDYLAKPFNPTLLRARVGASLEKKRLRDDVRASLSRLKQELDAAHALQVGMLPTVFPAWSPQHPVQVHALMEPAREVGGDLYDFFPEAEGVFCFLVGDVSGKGAPAAMFMARTRSLVRMAIQLWRQLGTERPTPARVAEAVNRELCQNNSDRMFVTLFLGFLDTRDGLLTYVNAGHLGPALLRASGAIERIDGKSELPLGIRSATAYHDRTASLLSGDAVFVFSDGVIEAMNVADEFYGDDRLKVDLGAVMNLEPAEMLRSLKAKVDGFTGEAPKADDVTMLALRWQPGTLLPQTTRLVIRNDVAELESVTRTMERLAAEHGIPQRSLIQLQVALDEMVSNIIKYAWLDTGTHEIEIRIAVRSDGVEVEIIDDGRMFNPMAALAPAKPVPGQRPVPGGVGLHITKQVLDGIEYARTGDRNHTTLTKRCTLGAGAK
jgi:sigma-B regulation protein RsbU (phosphoserine phosphatase)